MKLIELLDVMDENSNVWVLVDAELDPTILGWYDGKCGIDEKYNDAEVVRVSVDRSTASL